MKIAIANKTLALLAGVSMVATAAVSTAQAKPELVQLHAGKAGATVVKGFHTHANKPGDYYFTYYYTLYTSTANAKTIYTGWSLIDYTTCKEITPGVMVNDSAKSKDVKWSTGIYKEAKGAISSCPKLAPKFGSLFYDWKKPTATAGTSVEGLGVWTGVYSTAITYVITNYADLIWE